MVSGGEWANVVPDTGALAYFLSAGDAANNLCSIHAKPSFGNSAQIRHYKNCFDTPKHILTFLM